MNILTARLSAESSARGEQRLVLISRVLNPAIKDSTISSDAASVIHLDEGEASPKLLGSSVLVAAIQDFPGL